MDRCPSPRLLLLETSGSVAQIALAEGPVLVGVRRLDEGRRRARDLAPTVAALLREQNWQSRDLNAVVVSRGPGSYTGLRVGLISAKVLAYATGCALLTVDTFAVIAAQAPEGVERLDVLADAQQDKVYVQPFGREGETWRPLAPLLVRPFGEWLAERAVGAWVMGPGLRKWATKIPAGERVINVEAWEAGPESLLTLGLTRWRTGERDDPWTAEPLYLRPSSAEEVWEAKKKAPDPRVP